MNGPGLITHCWHAIGLSFWWTIFKVFNRVEVFGAENIPKKGEPGVMLLYNHISAIDPFLVAVTAMPFFSPIWWRAPAKAELFDVPIVRNIIASWGAFPVHRGKGDLKAIEKMAKLLQSSVVLIAPEGTRSTTGELLKGKSGVGKIIYDGRPNKVIPVRVRGVDLVLPKGAIMPRVGKKTQIHFGEPMLMDSFYALPESLETSRKIVDAVMEALGKL
ncbi:MAG: lysophospholipid acyltransferase family protein [Nitrospirota bacterium]